MLGKFYDDLMKLEIWLEDKFQTHREDMKMCKADHKTYKKATECHICEQPILKTCDVKSDPKDFQNRRFYLDEVVVETGRKTKVFDEDLYNLVNKYIKLISLKTEQGDDEPLKKRFKGVKGLDGDL